MSEKKSKKDNSELGYLSSALFSRSQKYNFNYSNLGLQISKDIGFIFAMLIGILGFTIVSSGVVSIFQYFEFTSIFKIVTGSLMLVYAKKFTYLEQS
jgi:hypothetical protein